MLRLLARRAGAQLPLLGAALAVVVVGATLLGTCALLLTSSQDRALVETARRAPADDVDATAFVVDVPREHVRSVTDDTRTVLTTALAPFTATTAVQASAAMRDLPVPRGTPRRWAYLAGYDDLDRRGHLIAGRWPVAAPSGTAPSGTAPSGTAPSGTARPGTAAAPLQAVVLEATARDQGLAPGDTVTLGREVPPNSAGPVTVTVVGVFRPLPDAGWARDPLGASGVASSFTDGRTPQGVHVSGPFVVALPDLLAGGSAVPRLEITAHPDLSSPSVATLDAVSASLGTADRRLARVLGDRVGIERIVSPLPTTLSVARSQQAVTGAAVLVVALLGTVLTAVALALAGRLATTLRTEETALLSTLGAGRGQLVTVAATEAALLGAVAAVVAVPLSGLAHAGLTHLPPLAAAGLATPPSVTGAQTAAVVTGALLLTALLVVPVLRPLPAQAVTRGRRGLLVRSGADVALAGLAAAGWWQLRAQPAAAAGGPDAVRVLAPALFLLTGAALVLRVVTPLLLGAERLARRSRGLVLPLAAFEAARRPQAVAAGLLLALACAAGTFGTAFGTTWERSQRDQADLRVGTDLALTLTAPPGAGEGRAVAAAAGGVITPVADRTVAVGEWLGGVGDPPRLVAVDGARAGAVLRGRLPGGRTWEQVGAALAPREAVTGIPMPPPGGPAPTLSGTAADGAVLIVEPTLVLQDGEGLRTPCTAAPVPLDGRPHPLQGCPEPGAAGRDAAGQGGAGQIVAVDLKVRDASPATQEAQGPGAFPGDAAVREGRMTVALTVPTRAAPGPDAPASWSATPVGDAARQMVGAVAGVSRAPGAAVLRTTATVGLGLPPDLQPEVVVTAFRPVGAVPVVVSRRLVDTLRAPPGTRLSLTVGATSVPVVVTGVVPVVPSAPGAVAVLADQDSLSRSLLTSGDLAPPVDAWWVGHPSVPDAQARADALRLGDVVTREGATRQLVAGPLRIGLPAALGVLIPAAVLLLLTGTVMHVTSDVEGRAVEVARLRGLGLSRRDILASLLLQHAGVLVLLLLGGAAVGGLATWVLGPLLIRSDLGAAPVPAALPRWPWPAETALLAGLLIACTAAVAAVVAVQVRRADAAHLRVGP